MKKVEKEEIDFAYIPTRLGKAIEKLYEQEDNQEYWRNFYEVFLNTKFYIPTAKMKDKKGVEYLIPLVVDNVDNKAKQHLLVFEKKKQILEWHKKNIQLGKSHANFFADSIWGYEYITEMQPALLKENDLYIDYGRKDHTCLIIESDILLYLRKLTLALLRKTKKEQELDK